MNICSCLLAFVLGWTSTAEIIHETVEEKTSVSLRCPHSVEDSVTWSRDSDGRKVNILTAGGEADMRHIHDPQRRYSSLADKSLHIRTVTVSDSGRYFCNSEAAVELTVIPPGTTRLNATEGTDVSLTCPPDVGGSHIKTWSSRNTVDLTYQRGFYVSPVDQTLTITSVELKHSGLYYCDGKPAAYLTVTKGQTTTSATTRRTRPAATSVPTTTPLTDEDTTTTKKQRNKKEGKKNKGNKTTTTTTTVPSTTPLTNKDTTRTKKQKDRTTTTTSTPTTTSVPSTTLLTDKDTTTTKKHNKKGRKKNKDRTTTTTTTATTGSNTPQNTILGLVFGIVAFLLLVIITVYFAWRRRIKRQGHAEICPVYEEIQDRVVFQPTNGGGSLAGPTASYCMTDFQDGSHHNDHMYATIPDLPRVEKKSETSLSNDSTYSLISNPLIGGTNKGPSQLPENTYFLLEKP